MVVGSGETTAKVGASDSTSVGADVMVTGERVASSVTLPLGDDDDDLLGEEELLLLGSIEGREVESSPGGQGSIGVSVGKGVMMIEGGCVDKVGLEVGQAGPPHPLPFDGCYIMMIIKKENVRFECSLNGGGRSIAKI